MKLARESKPKSAVAGRSPIDAEAVAAAIDAVATRHRLLDAAGAVFAEVGYDRAHVRDICERAKANVAAIKYHFGGKYQLYEAAIGYWFDRQQRLQPKIPVLRAIENDDLHGFVRMFVGRLLDRDKPVWHARLMAREMIEPTGVLDRMVAQGMMPMAEALRRIVRHHVGAQCSKVQLERAMLSIISQCVFYVHCRPVLERLFPEHVNNPDVDAIADHIATFSAAGLSAVCKSSTKRKAVRA